MSNLRFNLTRNICETLRAVHLLEKNIQNVLEAHEVMN